MPSTPQDRAETPDALAPEWAEYESVWAVDVADFGTAVEASQFLLRRRRIFQAAERAGIPKDMLTPFAPAKPGFEQRIEEAFAAIARSAGLAAE